MSNILTAFNTHLIDFITDIITIFPEKKGLRVTKTALETWRRVNPRSIILTWKEGITDKYAKEIQRGNIDFFLEKDYGSKQIIKNLVSDGVLVSTPAGSTAYNLSVHGPILSLNSKKISIAPISPFRPRRWKGKIVNDKSKIVIDNLNISKRPISAVADNLEVRNAKTIIIQINKSIKFNLLYDKNRSLQKKIKIEQLRRETS